MAFRGEKQLIIVHLTYVILSNISELQAMMVSLIQNQIR